MKIYVDDIRQPPDDTWILVRTNTEAISLLATGHVTEISLDHDIAYLSKRRPGDGMIIEGFTDETFKPVAYYISLMKERPTVLFHTANFDGGREMAKIIGCDFNHELGVR